MINDSSQHDIEITATEASALFGLKANTLYVLHLRGHIPARRAGTRNLWFKHHGVQALCQTRGLGIFANQITPKGNNI